MQQVSSLIKRYKGNNKRKNNMLGELFFRRHSMVVTE